MHSIFEGVDEYIDAALNVNHIGTRVPHYACKASALAAICTNSFEGVALLRRIADQIERNWAAAPRRTASPHNWRWEKKTYRSELNISKEKILEKRIVDELDSTWVNQIPTASGLLNSIEGQHRNVDLAHRISQNEYELIELKWDSDTPLFAAFEILKYGLLYLFSRQHAAELGYMIEDKHLLAADTVTLIVLAPSAYYGHYSNLTKWLGAELNIALNDYNPYSRLGVHMSFRFEQLLCENPTLADTNSILTTGRSRLHS